MQIYYLEIVTHDVSAVCEQNTAIHGVKFGDPEPSLGGARTAKLGDASLLGVRAPMSPTEEPIVRPYWLVPDIVASVAAAEQSGAETALPPTELPGFGQCAIMIQGGVQTGLWQKPE